MALAQVNFFSPLLAKMVAANVILPDVGQRPFAVLYLLHGLSDDHTAWQRRSRIEWYVRNLPLIVVMPDGARNFYTDNADGPAYAQFIAEDLPAFIERTFPARTDRAGRCIAGLSMGGYGAMRLALAHPDRYASAVSHSGALLAWRYQKSLTALSEAEHRRIFGTSPEGTPHDLLHLAKDAQLRGPLPALRVDCGTDDALIGVNRTFSAALEALKIPHEYAEHPGGHDWDYWDLHVRDAIAFHAGVLGLTPLP